MPNSPTALWTSINGTLKQDYVWSMTTGPDGSVYICGYTEASLDGQTFSGRADAFLTKFNPDGTKEWTRLIGSSGHEEAKSISVSSDGSVYVAGITGSNSGSPSDPLDGQANQGGGADGFLAKFDSRGNKIWTKLIGSSAYDDSQAVIAIGQAIFVTGNTSGSISGQSTIGQRDVYLAKFDPSGTLSSVTTFGSTYFDEVRSIAAAIDGSVYVVGRTEGWFDRQGNEGSYDSFLTKFNPTGTKLWTRLLGTSKSDAGHAVGVGPDGSVYVGGETEGNLGGQQNFGFDAFTAKYSTDGSLIWVRLISSQGYGYDSLTSIALDQTGIIYLGGISSGDLGGQVNLSPGDYDGFVVSLDSSGSTLWSLLIGTSSQDQVKGLVALNDGLFYVSGITGGNLNGQTAFSNADAFVAKYATTAAETSPPSYSVSANQSSINEGSTASFTVTTTNVASGTALAYTLSGVSASDITGGSLSGTTTVGSNGQATISVPIAADQTTEGNETLTVTVQGKTASTTITDTLTTPTTATYSLSANQSSVNEGSDATFTLTTTNIGIGTSLEYILIGVLPFDIVGGTLSGTVKVGDNGISTIRVSIAQDQISEASQKLTVAVMGHEATVVINDTSKSIHLDLTL